MSPPHHLCPTCGAANESSVGRCRVCGQPLSAEQAMASDPAQPTAPPRERQRTISRRAVVVGIAAGAIAVLGGGAYLAYTLIPREHFDPLPPILTYTAHSLARDAAWSPDGTRVASIGWPYGGADPQAVHVWDATTGKRLLLCALDGAAAGLSPAGVVWSADGARLLALVTGSAITTIDRVQVWDAATGQPVRSISVRRTATTWALNERYLALATQVSPEGAARRGMPTSATPTPPATPKPPPSPTPSATPVPPPTALPYVVVEVWDLTTGNVVATLAPGAPSEYIVVQKMVWATNSSTLAVAATSMTPGQSGNECHLWDATTGKELLTIAIPSQEFDVIAWSRDGRSLAMGTTAFAAATGQRTATYPVGGYLEALAWAPNGARIAVWVRTGTGLYSTKYDVIALTDVPSGRQIAIYNDGPNTLGVGPLGGQSRLAWSPDGKRLLVLRTGVEVWNLG